MNDPSDTDSLVDLAKLFSGPSKGFSLPTVESEGGQELAPGMPEFELPTTEAPKFQDLTEQIPDICKAMSPLENFLDLDQPVPCPTCGYPGCGAREAIEARAMARNTRNYRR